MPATKSWIGASPLVIAFALSALLSLTTAVAEPVTVRYPEGVLHAFLELQSMGGRIIAWGETTQVIRGERVLNHMMFRFNDGSLYDETTVFSQRGSFRLVSDHLIQKGPAFRQSMDRTLDVAKNEVVVRDLTKENQKPQTEHLELPPDLANGLLFTVVKDISPDVPKATLSMVATTPKIRIVKLEITRQGAAELSEGHIRRKASHFLVKVQIPGVTGAIAHLIGKQPPNLHIWVVENEAPGFMRFEGPLEADGAVWRIQMAPPPVFKPGP